jgi:hypothetical protein
VTIWLLSTSRIPFVSDDEQLEVLDGSIDDIAARRFGYDQDVVS